MIIRPNGPSRPRRESLRPRGFSMTSPSCRSAAAVNQPANPTLKPKLDRGEHRHTINSGETPPRTAPTDLTQKIVGCLVRCLLVDESVGKPDSVPAACDRRRSSICDRCCQRPGAIYPETRASSPQASPQALARPRDLAPGGVYRATPVTWSAGGLLHRRFTLTGLRTARRSAFCGTVPRVTPGGRYPPPCSVESGLSSATLPGGRDRLTDSSDSDVTARSSKDARPRPSTAGSSRASVGL